MEDLLHEMGRASEPGENSQRLLRRGQRELSLPHHPAPAGHLPGALRPHTHEFCAATITDTAHQTIADGAEFLSAMALRVFNDEDFRRRVRASFEESLKAKQ